VHRCQYSKAGRHKRAAQASRGQHVHLCEREDDARPVTPLAYYRSDQVSQWKEEGDDGTSVYYAASNWKASTLHEDGWQDDRRRRLDIDREKTIQLQRYRTVQPQAYVPSYRIVLPTRRREEQDFLLLVIVCHSAWPASGSPVLPQALRTTTESLPTVSERDGVASKRSMSNACCSRCYANSACRQRTCLADFHAGRHSHQHSVFSTRPASHEKTQR